MAGSSAARSVETLIKALQKALAPLPTRSALKQDVLYLMVDLPRQGMFSRSMVLHRVASQLGGLPVQGVSQLVVYGRLQGETQPQWKKSSTCPLGKAVPMPRRLYYRAPRFLRSRCWRPKNLLWIPTANPIFAKLKP